MVSGTMNCYLDEVGNFNSIKVLRVLTPRTKLKIPVCALSAG